jgi:hypothetical protein
MVAVMMVMMANMVVTVAAVVVMMVMMAGMVVTVAGMVVTVAAVVVMMVTFRSCGGSSGRQEQRCYYPCQNPAGFESIPEHGKVS